MSFGCGAWALHAWFTEGSKLALAGGIFSIAGGIGLVVYGRYFLKKLKDVSYL